MKWFVVTMNEIDVSIELFVFNSLELKCLSMSLWSGRKASKEKLNCRRIDRRIDKKWKKSKAMRMKAIGVDGIARGLSIPSPLRAMI